MSWGNNTKISSQLIRSGNTIANSQDSEDSGLGSFVSRGGQSWGPLHYKTNCPKPEYAIYEIKLKVQESIHSVNEATLVVRARDNWYSHAVNVGPQDNQIYVGSLLI